MRGEAILLPLRFGEGWGGVFRIYVRGLVILYSPCDGEIEERSLTLPFILSKRTSSVY